MTQFRVNAKSINLYNTTEGKHEYIKENEIKDSADYSKEMLLTLASNGHRKKLKGSNEYVWEYKPSVEFLDKKGKETVVKEVEEETKAKKAKKEEKKSTKK